MNTMRSTRMLSDIAQASRLPFLRAVGLRRQSNSAHSRRPAIGVGTGVAVSAAAVQPRRADARGGSRPAPRPMKCDERGTDRGRPPSALPHIVQLFPAFGAMEHVATQLYPFLGWLLVIYSWGIQINYHWKLFKASS